MGHERLTRQNDTSCNIFSILLQKIVAQSVDGSQACDQVKKSSCSISCSTSAVAVFKSFISAESAEFGQISFVRVNRKEQPKSCTIITNKLVINSKPDLCFTVCVMLTNQAKQQS
jgi:hypothetical protein